MNGRVGDAAVFAVGVQTGVALNVDGLFAKRATRVFALSVRNTRCGAGRDLTGLAAKRAIVRGARVERPWRAVLGRVAGWGATLENDPTGGAGLGKAGSIQGSAKGQDEERTQPPHDR